MYVAISSNRIMFMPVLQEETPTPGVIEAFTLGSAPAENREAGSVAVKLLGRTATGCFPAGMKKQKGEWMGHASVRDGYRDPARHEYTTVRVLDSGTEPLSTHIHLARDGSEFIAWLKGKLERDAWAAQLCQITYRA
jgi:hypothetical protein